MRVPSIHPGQRWIVAGRTGVGKTSLIARLLEWSPAQHWVILNPKHTRGYAGLPDAVTLLKFDRDRFDRQIKAHRFVILNLSHGEAETEFMDDLVAYLHDTYRGLGLCVDELYTLHNNGVAGPGLIAWITRGRELRQSFVGMTQRPKFVSKFVFSEASAIIGMDLQLSDDRKTMREHTGSDKFLRRLTPFQWRYHDVARDVNILFGPVSLTPPHEAPS
jgi:hypothetical protein